ncbi:MAG: aldo/keto reductase, partial [Pseudomonadota bacterium]|nr:aldo/keto reductase [Pseudomonadota bacterium]
IVLASKYSMTTDSSDPNASGNHRKNMAQSIDNSLKRLKTDYLDLYWVHGWDQSTPIDEVMRALDDLVRTGKVLHIGVSNCPAWLISQANTIAKERNMTSFTALQLHYNLTDRSIENDFFDLAQEYGMSITAWSPLAGGLLSGKYNSNPEIKGRLNNVSYGPRLLAEDRIKLAQEVKSIADRIGCETSALALAWLLQRPQGSVIPILGARTLDQLKANLTCLDLNLNEADVEKMDKLNPPPAVYPSSLFRSSFFNQLMHGEYGLIDS